jgi:hypothetical protein
VNRKATVLIVVLVLTAVFAGLWVLLPKHYQLGEHMGQAFAFWNDHEAFVFLNLDVSGRTTNALQEKLLRSHLGTTLLLVGWNDMFYQQKVVAYHLLPTGKLDRFELAPDATATGTWSLKDGQLQLTPVGGIDHTVTGFRWDGVKFVSLPPSESPAANGVGSVLTEDDIGEGSPYPSLIPPSERAGFRKGGWHVKTLNGYEGQGTGATLPMQIGRNEFSLILRSTPLSTDVFNFGALNIGAQAVEIADNKTGGWVKELWRQNGWREVPKAEYETLAQRHGRKINMPGMPWMWLIVIVGLLIWKMVGYGNLLFSVGSVKSRIMKSIPTGYSFPPASPGQFSGLDATALDRYTREFESLGFIRLADLSLVSDGPSYAPNFCRVMANTRNHCFAEIAQYFPVKKPVWPMRCALFGGLQDGWTVTFSDRKPLAASSLLRRPQAIAISMPETAVPELLQAFISMRDQVAIDLGIAPMKDDTIEAFMSKMQRAVSEVRQSVQNKNFATVIPEIYFRKFSLLKTRPEYVWMGDYPKMAEQRKQGHLTASGTKI